MHIAFLSNFSEQMRMQARMICKDVQSSLHPAQIKGLAAIADAIMAQSALCDEAENVGARHFRPATPSKDQEQYSRIRNKIDLCKDAKLLSVGWCLFLFFLSVYTFSFLPSLPQRPFCVVFFLFLFSLVLRRSVAMFARTSPHARTTSCPIVSLACCEVKLAKFQKLQEVESGQKLRHTQINQLEKHRKRM
jgi:hypothetical protein